MMKKTFARIVLGSALVAILIACAKINTPSGGPRDRTPPVALRSTPPKATVNFKGNKIEIEFDEFLVLDNINEKFMVSPPMKKKPRVFLKGKSVMVEFNEKLKDSTTYTFYFQDGIKDLNEGNVLPNYQFVLSTGPVIDSLSVTGNIYNAKNLEIPEKTEVLMHRELADSAVLKHLPQYLARVDPTGYFRFDNVRPGTYRLFGLKETDNSKSYNLPEEEFAFMDSTISVTSEKNYIPPVKDTVIAKPVVKKAENKNTKPAKVVPGQKKEVKKTTTPKDTTNLKKIEPPPLIGEYKLYMFLARKKAHYLLSSKREPKFQLLYILSLPPDSMHFDFSIKDADSKDYFLERSRNRDTLRVWLTDSTLYSKPAIQTLLNYPYTDTLGKLVYKKDTVMMRFAFPRPTRTTAKKKKTSFTFENNISTGALKPGQTIVFNSQTPFRQPDTSKIKLYELIQTAKSKVPYSLIKDSTISTRYYLKTKLIQGKKYLFVADSAAFGNVFKEVSDSIGIKFSIKPPDTYSKITLNIKNYEGDMIIQLLDKTEKLVAETKMKKPGKVEFTLLDPGTYRARVIYDLNGDGVWTTGDFTVKRQPEPVSYYNAELELKTGWDLIQDWDLGVQNFKDPKLVEKKKLK